MIAWEYLIKRHRWDNKHELDKLGTEGWELVCVDDGSAYFKRPAGECGVKGIVWTVYRRADQPEDVDATDATPWPVRGCG